MYQLKLSTHFSEETSTCMENTLVSYVYVLDIKTLFDPLW
jgi:hypothetical protein